MNENPLDLPELGESEWWLILYLLCLDCQKEAEDLIQDFETELIYHNRFSSDHKVIEELQISASRATKEVPAGTMFFRARVFHEYIVDKLVKRYLVERGSSNDEIEEILTTWEINQKALLITPGVFMDADNIPHHFTNKQALKRAFQKWKKNTRFKGYNAKKSTAPSADKVGDGRANPDHIRYLYLCEDKLTTVYEVRACVGDQVSIAKFRLEKDIRLYDLTSDFVSQEAVESTACLFSAISAMYSRPYKGKRENYIATQFIAEEIKKMGFDGLRFKSSLHKDGYNIVLFNPEICKPISSDLAYVSDIEIKTELPWFYNLEQ